MPQKLLTVQQVAKQMDMDPDYIRVMVIGGGFPEPYLEKDGRAIWLESDIIGWATKGQPRTRDRNAALVAMVTEWLNDHAAKIAVAVAAEPEA